MLGRIDKLSKTISHATTKSLEFYKTSSKLNFYALVMQNLILFYFLVIADKFTVHWNTLVYCAKYFLTIPIKNLSNYFIKL